MALADRVGLGGLILTLASLAIAILWPNKKWVGWASLGLAVVLSAIWLWLEIRTPTANFFSSHPVLSTITVFTVGGILASSAWLWAMRSSAALIQLPPAGFVTFVGQVLNGSAPMTQVNQTDIPLDDVHLSVTQSVLKSAHDPGPWTSEWQKEIEVGTARAKLTIGLPERFFVGNHDWVR